jgi:hypothetical protein
MQSLLRILVGFALLSCVQASAETDGTLRIGV